jgi:Ser/Thr protein kinase RdoA (MazF antagonist)
MAAGPPGRVLDALRLRPPVSSLKDMPLGNASWLVEDHGGGRLVLRRYHAEATPDDLAYEHAVLRSVIDFGLTHLDSRPYELAIARISRSRAALEGYRAELAHLGWPLSELEEAAIDPIARAFRVDLLAWHLNHARKTGSYDVAFIERQLSATCTAPP